MTTPSTPVPAQVPEPVAPGATDELRGARLRGLLLIGEVARRTGVTAVTLRAWERRYGLIVPERTPKGHRLYSPADVERICEVLRWLNRGIAVGQIKPLLDGAPSAPVPLAASYPGWETLRQAMGDAVRGLRQAELEEHFSRAAALYPARTICAELLQPLAQELAQRWELRSEVAALERGFFATWLRTHLAMRIHQLNRGHSGAPVLFMAIGTERSDSLWPAAWLVAHQGFTVEVIDAPLGRDAVLAAQLARTPSALVLFGLEPGTAPEQFGIASCPRLGGRTPTATLDALLAATKPVAGSRQAALTTAAIT